MEKHTSSEAVRHLSLMHLLLPCSNISRWYCGNPNREPVLFCPLILPYRAFSCRCSWYLQVTKEAITAAENDGARPVCGATLPEMSHSKSDTWCTIAGIIFVDEIDKICTPSNYRHGSDASSEGVQRDMLPIIEGCTVSTKHGNVSTNHMLFIASGAFHSVKPSDRTSYSSQPHFRFRLRHTRRQRIQRA